MESNRIEKKFVYTEGDDSYKFFLINGMFKKLYPDRKINSLYFDTDDLKNVSLTKIIILFITLNVVFICIVLIITSLVI